MVIYTQNPAEKREAQSLRATWMFHTHVQFYTLSPRFLDESDTSLFVSVVQTDNTSMRQSDWGFIFSIHSCAQLCNAALRQAQEINSVRP